MCLDHNPPARRLHPCTALGAMTYRERERERERATGTFWNAREWTWPHTCSHPGESGGQQDGLLCHEQPTTLEARASAQIGQRSRGRGTRQDRTMADTGGEMTREVFPVSCGLPRCFTVYFVRTESLLFLLLLLMLSLLFRRWLPREGTSGVLFGLGRRPFPPPLAVPAFFQATPHETHVFSHTSHHSRVSTETGSRWYDKEVSSALRDDYVGGTLWPLPRLDMDHYIRNKCRDPGQGSCRAQR